MLRLITMTKPDAWQTSIFINSFYPILHPNENMPYVRLNCYQHEQSEIESKKGKWRVFLFPLSIIRVNANPDMAMFKSHTQKAGKLHRSPALFTTCTLAVTSVSQVTVITSTGFILWMLMCLKRCCF